MTTEREIEQLFAAAGPPAPRDGLKERVLEAAARPRAAVPAPVKWAVAAAFMLGVLLNVAAGLDGPVAEWESRPAAARDGGTRGDSTERVGALALFRGGAPDAGGVDMAERTARIDRLLKGDPNGA